MTRAIVIGVLTGLLLGGAASGLLYLTMDAAGAEDPYTSESADPAGSPDPQSTAQMRSHLTLAAELRRCAADVRALRAHASGPRSGALLDEAEEKAAECRRLQAQIEVVEESLESPHGAL